MAIREKGNKWQVDVTVKGIRAPRVSADTYAQAEQIEAEFKALLLKGIMPAVKDAPQASAKGTIGALLDATYKQKWAGAKAEASSLRNGTAWVTAFGQDTPLKDVTPDRVAEICDTWAVNGNASGTINRKLAALSVMLGVAEERGLIARKFKLPKRKEYEGRLRWYDDEEVESLITYASGAYQYLFIAAVETGMRQSELLGLTVRDVDAKNNLILLGATKGNKRRSVPMTERCRLALSDLTQGRKAHEKVFPDHLTCRNISRVIGAWKGARGMPTEDEACFHTFRHTCCSRLVQRGVPIVVVQKWMGHASIQTTMRYAHLAPDSLDIALKALESPPQ